MIAPAAAPHPEPPPRPEKAPHPDHVCHTENTSSTPLTPKVAAGFLADLGFLVVPNVPSRSIDGFLLVAIRDHPTLQHYDPEEADYWVDAGLHGCAMSLWRRTKMPIHDAFSWGVIRIVDRLHVTNDFLTFGGTMRAEEVDGTAIVVFRSMAPMLRLGGHSQVSDDAAVPLATFFGRLRGVMTVSPVAERRVIARRSDVPVRRLHLRRRGPLREGAHPPGVRAQMWHIFQTERARMQHEQPAAWSAGQELATIVQPAPSAGHRELRL